MTSGPRYNLPEFLLTKDERLTWISSKYDAIDLTPMRILKVESCFEAGGKLPTVTVTFSGTLVTE